MPTQLPAAASPVEPRLTAQASAQSIQQHLRHAPPAVKCILQALVEAQARHTLFLPGQPVLVAVSGGADSLCLLHALHQLAPFWRLALHVAHLDHALRPDSGDDARFVSALAHSFGLPFSCTRLEVGTLDDDPRGLEAAARSARYAFLRQIAAEIAPDQSAMTIATAHHQDDQAETVLLHLIQGSGLAGLAGMAWVGELPDNQEPALRLVRPLLGVSRTEIVAYLHTVGLAWREDSTNLDPTYLRNRLRHQVLPLLATINPNIHATLARSAELLAAEADHATRRDQAALTVVMQTHTPSTRLALDLFHLAQYDLATRRGVLRLALQTLGIDLRIVGMEAIETVLDASLLDRTRQAEANGPHPLTAGWAWTLTQPPHSSTGTTGALLVLHRAELLPLVPEYPHLGAPLPNPLAIPPQGALAHAGWTLHSTLFGADELPGDWRARSEPGKRSWRFFGDALVCDDLYLTTFRPGMSITPLGMGGHTRALGDIFTDHKVPTFLRPGWPVVVNGGGETVWLCGLVVSEPARVQPATRQIRHLRWQQETEPAQ